MAGGIATAAIGSSFVISLLVFVRLSGLVAESRVLEEIYFPWIHVSNLAIDASLRVDALSSLFLLVITGVGTLIHVYSIGYMSHDPSPGKFFAYLNLFCFAMLVLVMGSSLPILFLGWEGVGLCSYLLIGFWYTDEEKAKAGKKAFIVNRVGDLGFVLGMFLLFSTFGTLDFVALKAAVTAGTASIDPAIFTAIALLLFVGCMGKSAQIPLYVWLPDAMAGPTPVSALIHAATMVTSGVYLVSRMNFLFSLSHEAMMVMAGVGAATAFFAATIAIAQNDIKKILAYSTVSQLGYMFLACGVGAYGAGVFHVITHAFFKALLFLGAGSVIHGMHEEQDILKMGGLRKLMPKTFLVFAIAWLAICGIPPFSGFFSKDEILWQAFASSHGGGVVLWVFAALTAVMTAFYMTRLVYLTFFGHERFANKADRYAKVIPHGKGHAAEVGVAADEHGHDQGSGVHESPNVMILPLQMLAVLSIVGGFLSIPHLSWLEHWLDPVIPAGHQLREGVSPAMEWFLMALSVIGAAGGIFGAIKLYSNLAVAGEWKARLAVVHRLLANKWYVDEIYDALIVRPLGGAATFLWKGIDVWVIDRTVLNVARIAGWSGQVVRLSQTGSIQFYGFVLIMGLLVFAGYTVYGII